MYLQIQVCSYKYMYEGVFKAHAFSYMYKLLQLYKPVASIHKHTRTNKKVHIHCTCSYCMLVSSVCLLNINADMHTTSR